MLKNETEITQILGKFYKKNCIKYRNTEVVSHGFKISHRLRSKYNFIILYLN